MFQGGHPHGIGRLHRGINSVVSGNSPAYTWSPKVREFSGSIAVANTRRRNMKKIVAMILSLALAVPTASLLAQQAPTQVKQPVQVAQGGLPNFSLFGMGAAASIAVVVVAAALV